MKNRIILNTIFSFFVIVNLFYCSHKKSGGNNKDKTHSEYIKIIKQIKERTKKDLNKLGVKKVLLYNNGTWYSGGNTTVIFKKNGRLIDKFNDRIFKIMLWKVDNNKLYINPNIKDFKKYFSLDIDVSSPPSYTVGPKSDPNKYLKKIMYVLDIGGMTKSNNKKFGWGYTLKIFKKGAFKKAK